MLADRPDCRDCNSEIAVHSSGMVGLESDPVDPSIRAAAAATAEQQSGGSSKMKEEPKSWEP